MSRRRLVSASAVVLLMTVLTAGAWYLLGGRAQEIRTDAGLVLIGARDGGGMDSLFRGLVAITDGGCIGGEEATVIWPHGTEVVDRDPLVLRVPGNGELRLGDEVDLAGGFVFEPSSDGEPREFSVAGVTVPEACTTGGVFLAD